MMKYHLRVLLGLCFSINILSAEASISVFACEPEWAALTVELLGDSRGVYSATSALQDPHHVQARPSLIAKARAADLLICTGAGLEEGWLPLLLRKSANKRIQVGEPGYFMATEHVPLLDKHSNVDRSMGDVHGMGNPHIQLDPDNMVRVARALAQTLMGLMPERAEAIDGRAKDFVRQIQEAQQRWLPLRQALQDKNMIVHHDSWVYLTQWLQMHKVATLEPKPGVAPSTAHLASLLDVVTHNKADIIIHSAYQDNRAAQWLANRASLPVVSLNSSVKDWQQHGALIHWYQGLLEALNTAISTANNERDNDVDQIRKGQ